MKCLRDVCVGLFVVLLAPQIEAENAELKDGVGVDLVRAHCSGCHSLSLVTSQRGDRDYWLNLIRWMQNTQNLWQIPAAQEAMILDYLAEHYDESVWGRRPPLSLDLQGPLD